MTPIQNTNIPRPILVKVPLTPQQTNVVFQHTGQWLTELSLNENDLKVLTSPRGILATIK